MKIDTTHLQALGSTQSTEAAAKSSDTGKTGGLSSVEDSVGLSPIGLLAAKIDNISEERIQELRRQVTDGSYNVDAQKISQRLVQSMLDK